MQFELTDTQKDIQKAAREFAEKEFDPDLALELDRERRFPKAIFEKACRLGFVGIDYPEAYGGQAFGLFENVLVIEEFSRKDSGIGISLSLADMASSVILKHGDENQKKKFLTPLTQGKLISVVALFESSRTSPSIEPCSEGYVLDGGKTLIANGSLANVIAVLSKSAAMIVERNWEGVRFLGLKKMMGMRISSVHEVTFDHVKVPKEYVISTDGTFPLTTYRRVHRTKTAAQALGIAQGVFDQAVKHSKEREQFGKKIIQFQGIQFMLAELSTSIEAARSLVYRTALDYDAGMKEGEELSSMAKLFATEIAVRAAIDSIQIHGGVGLMKEYPIERMFRDAKTIQNLDEPNLVQKALIARKIIS